MDLLKKDKKLILNIVLLFVIFISIILISVGYASISDIELSIDGQVSASVNDGVFISNVQYKEDSGADLSKEEVRTNGTILNSTVSLSSTDVTSYITYNVTIYNNSTSSKVFNGVTYDNAFYTNEDIVFEINGLEERSQISKNGEVTFTITFKYNTANITNTDLTSVLNFTFTDSNNTMNNIIDKEQENGEIEEFNDGDVFESVATTPEESGLKSILDPNTNELMYFYRGIVNDNYVYFAGYMWRILRINSDGSLRIILDDSIGTSQYRTSNVPDQNTIESAIDALTWENSLVYQKLHEWYSQNLEVNYDDYILNSNYMFELAYTLMEHSAGSADEVYYFDTYYRVATTDDANYNNPKFFDEIHNVVDKIGIITADEIMYAGGNWQENNTVYFLYNSNLSGDFWTMSPAFWDSNTHHKIGMILFNSENGYMHDWPNGGNTLTSSLGIRPVITIRGDLEMDGTGDFTDPYKYVEEEIEYNMEVGAYVNYTPDVTETSTYTSEASNTGYTSNQVFTLGNYSNVRWRILSIGNSNEVTLISDDIFDQTGVGAANYYLNGYKGYANGSQELNNICNSLFANSKYAKEVRSINANDVNTIAGFNVATYSDTNASYGQQIQYSYSNNFAYYLDESQIEPIQVGVTDNITVTNTFYTYSGNSNLSTSSVQYEMLFKDTGTKFYWVDAKYARCFANYVDWGLFGVGNQKVEVWYMYRSSNESMDRNYGIRAIVELKPNVKFTPNTSGGEITWDISIK